MFASRCVGGLRVPCVVILLVVVLAIFAYGYLLRRLGHPDVLERPVIDDPAWVGFDGWGATHLFLWCFLGWWYPGHSVQALVVALLWEGFEDTLGRSRLTVGGSRLQLVGAVDETTGERLEDSEQDSMRWYGRFTTDSFFNLAGYTIGAALSKKFWPKDACGCARCAGKKHVPGDGMMGRRDVTSHHH